MKTNFFISVILAMLIAVISCKSKARKDAKGYMNKIEKTVKENSPADNQQKTSTGPFVIPEGMENIVGEWKLTSIVIDKNANDKIEDDEKSGAIIQANDYMKLNSDGTAVFSQIKMKGHYQIKPNSDGTSKYLNLFDKTDSKYSKGEIVSVTNNELILLSNFSGSSFYVWKRI
jgi:hypothetical protein